MEQEFTVATGWKIFYGLIAAFMAGFAMFLFTLDHSKAGEAVLLLPIFILLFALLIALSQFRKKVTISVDTVIQINAFTTKELPTKDIKGYRIGEKVIYIEPISSVNPKIAIGNWSDMSGAEDLTVWIRENFTDLDAADLKNEKDKLLHDTDLGFSEQEREEKLAKAKRIALVYTITGIATGIAALFFSDNYLVTTLALSFPLIGIAVMKTSNGLIKFFSNRKRSVYPYILFGFYIPVLVPFFSSVLEYDIFKYDNIWLPVVGITVITAVALLTVGVNKSVEYPKSQMVVMILLAMFYGYGSTVKVNCVFDKSPLKVYHATVLSRRMERGKSNTYYFTLSPWGPRTCVEEVTVRRWLYNEVPNAGFVTVNFKDGLLNIPWYTVSD